MAAQGQPTFSGFLKASGQAEIWDDTDKKKFQQFGWRTTTNESAYSNKTLIGNWNEERFDVSKIVEPRPLPSQYDHCFETTYKYSHCHEQQYRVPDELQYSKSNESTAYPGHQPVLDPPELKQLYNNFLSCSQDAYRPPQPVASIPVEADNSADSQSN